LTFLNDYARYQAILTDGTLSKTDKIVREADSLAVLESLKKHNTSLHEAFYDYLGASLFCG